MKQPSAAACIAIAVSLTALLGCGLLVWIAQQNGWSELTDSNAHSLPSQKMGQHYEQQP